ncbi:hypothetical protein F6J84_06620 [Microbacterium caowuchunii]|uniref:hypothetical protein n=1 Tax=Microbacterium caowuchunii TaxID=2614638 RepID=UPI001247DD43|nr:hypothetical protein [Microbacterium caowuchunii]QEV99802.1 hypothetical protein F6J84_06620 [Microbacterium caowuchunii]
MSTLHLSPSVSVPPQTTPSAPLPRPVRRRSTDRMSFVDRAAMRVGLRLVAWGLRHARRTLSVEAHDRQEAARQARQEHDRAIAYAALTSRIL